MAEASMIIEDSVDHEIRLPILAAEKKCYTMEEIQTILNISRPTAYRLIRQKRFHAFQIGSGKWRISKKSFDEWLDSVS